MRSFLAILLFVCAASVASAQIFPRRDAAGSGGGGAAAAAVEAPECATVRAESRSDGVGFTHVVMVTNRCRVAVRCELATDADPTPTHPLRVPAGRDGEVVVRLASPAPGVAARGRCSLEGGQAPPPRAD